MVDFILFMVFSIMETMAMYYLMFRLFKFDMYPVSIVFASAVASFISYTIRIKYDFSSIDIIIQIILMFMFVWLLFRVNAFYAGIMTSTTYLSYVLLQMLYYLLMKHIGFFDARAPFLNEYGTYVLQVITAFTAWSLGFWIKTKRKGFDFVPHSPFGLVKMNKINISLLSLNVLGFFGLAAIFYSFLLNKSIQLIYLSLILTLIMYFILYLSYKKDRSDE
ncbi:hypothetical protein ABEX47_17005 [Paenibacillus ehimensis]|uniref:hypothetical protein n=1 Tax=Paenibacillus ehimensis TaxID=79264 RepID=UPI00046FC1AE|nr:hypothetical protein [Paenibacillus ehimensis]MEC0209585.1 hypothetical protein [Paenibacillus ehimensis]